MNERPEVLTVVRQWVERAEHDLRTAEHTLALEDDCPYDTICFHAQQCSEKYLKALLTRQGIDFPRTHDLTELFALIASDLPLSMVLEELAELTPYAIEARYPGNWELQTQENALRAVEIARSVRLAARSHLPV
ncbi:MAG: HEPN domain-containing protein [Chloroflexi bacterium]|nr:HEPN domain-containing protein [Chloroflexota bacterium]